MKQSRTGLRWLTSALAVPAILIAGCSAPAAEHTNGDEAAPTLDIPRGLASTPAGVGEVDHVTWNLIWGEPSSLDWLYAYADSTNTTLANMCEGLMRQNEDMTLSPALAERVDYPDETTAVFTIRDGVSFWDGTPLTAEDVAFSLNRHLDPEAGSYWGVPFYDNVESIEVTGDLEVTVSFSQPDSLFERMLATAAGIIGQQAYTEEAGEAYGTASGGIMCTGPFMFKSWNPGSSIVMEANPDYWDEDLRPLVQELELTFVTDESTVANSLISGDIDGTYMPPLAATETLARADNGSFVLGLGTDWLAIRPTERDSAMHQLEMRQALSYLLDREAIAQAVFRGTAEASMTPIQPGAWGYAIDRWEDAYANIPAPEYSVDRAREIIEDSGLEGTELTIAIPADSEAEVKSAEILSAGARSVGITINVEALPMTTFTELYFDEAARASYDAFIVWEYGAGVADPVVTMSEFTPLSAYNYGSYDDPVLTSAVTDALTTLDPEARAEALITGQARMVEDLPLINIVTLDNRLFQNSRITGATASRASLYYPWAAKIGSPE